MLQKKLCVLGAFGVGKTSLIRRYVESIFSDEYLTTVGVKVDKKTVMIGTESITLVLWDIAGEDDTTAVPLSYLRGAAGYLLVADGTRRETLDIAHFIRDRVVAALGRVPYALLLNKMDLQEEWQLSAVDEAVDGPLVVIRTSARTGEGIEHAFAQLAACFIR